MADNRLIRAGIVGVGGMARHYIRQLLERHRDDTRLVAFCEPSEASMAAVKALFAEYDLKPPPNEPDFARFLDTFAAQLDAVFIMTPHAFHHDQAKACLEAGVDVLLEKPMVMTADEARSLIATRDRTGKHLVVAFQGSLSPQVRTAAAMIHNGDIGELRSISASIWQGWRSSVGGTWREQPELSGGGFMFDTGAHMLNTVAHLAGQDFVEVAAWLDARSCPVDIMGTVMARLASGALVTMHGCGDTIRTCKSDIMVYGSAAILRTGAWGEKLAMQRNGEDDFTPVEVAPSRGAWEQFLRVLWGEIENPSPPEVGLRMAKLWDAIRESAAQGGAAVTMC